MLSLGKVSRTINKVRRNAPKGYPYVQDNPNTVDHTPGHNEMSETVAAGGNHATPMGDGQGVPQRQFGAVQYGQWAGAAQDPWAGTQGQWGGNFK